MQTIYIQLREIQGETVELRYRLPQQKHYESRTLLLGEISALLQQGQDDFYQLFPDLIRLGKLLFFWLDGNGRWLTRAIEQCRGTGLIMAIHTSKSFAHLPWEVLYNDKGFLVNQNPAVVPVRWIEKDAEVYPIEARRLRVLFMATDPENVTPKLDFEQEEARILADTHDIPLELRVEESGCTQELGKVWSRYINTFDVFHLTGHASIKNESPFTPYFITETEIGERHETTAEELAEVLRYRFPQLVFLSGCRTGEAGNQGAVPSMAEALIEQGAKTVLSWGRPVLERTATATAAHFYGKLAAGYQLAEALATTYKYLLKNNIKDWHLLRLYVRGECPTAFVEPVGDVPWIAPEPSYQQFLDPQTQLVRVATPAEFVGRRRTLQRCLKEIRKSSNLGLLIHGLGGVGKSTVTARLLERLPGYDKLVIYRELDEDKLLKVLSEQCTSERGHEILNGKLPLMQRLTKFFQEGLNKPEQRFIFVLDDFEANLELIPNTSYTETFSATSDNLNITPLQAGALLKSNVVEVLMALLKAVQNSKLPHRIVITSRYIFQLPELNHRLYAEPLGALQDADLDKKYQRLEAFNGNLEIDKGLSETAKKAADGNPRLLEWLNQILLNPTPNSSPQARRGVNAEGSEGDAMAEILQKMADAEAKFRENILAEELLKLQNYYLRTMLGKLLVYELPVSIAAISPICADIPFWQNHLERAASLGLLEVTLTHDGGKRLYRVPRILAPLLAFPEGEKAEELYQEATQLLYRLWWEESETTTEAQALEIHRLALLGKDGEIAAKTANFLARSWIKISRFQETRKICEDTLKNVNHYHILSNLARVEQELGDVMQAVSHYQEALKLCPDQDISERLGIQHNLASIKYKNGNLDEALEVYFQCLEASKQIRNIKAQANALHQIAFIYNIQGKVDEALAKFEECLLIQESNTDLSGQSTTLHNIAYIKHQKGQITEALAAYQKSFQLKESIGDVKGQVAVLQQIASMLEDQDNLESASNYWQTSLQLLEQVDSLELKAATFYNISLTIAILNEL